MRVLSALVLAVTLAACTGTPPADPAGGDGETPADKAETTDKADADGSADAADAKPADPCADSTPKPVDPQSLTPTPLPDDADPAMTDPTKAVAEAPAQFDVVFETTAGDFTVRAHRDWSPKGVDRFYNLVKIGWFDGQKFFRNIDGFMVQFGISPYPEANAAWSEARIEDEPVVTGNKRHIVTFAKCGMPNCRSTQLFINHRDNTMLDAQGFAGIGEIVAGADVVDKLYDCYGEGAPRGRGPRQDLIQKLGNAYLEAGWPKMDTITDVRIVEGGADKAEGDAKAE